MTEQKTTQLTAEQVREYRAMIKAHREAQKAEAAARRNRRAERAEEIKEHRHAEDDAQSRIDTTSEEIRSFDKDIAMARAEIAMAHEKLSLAVGRRKVNAELREIAYADRAAAKRALAKLNDEIRYGESTASRIFDTDEDAAAAEERARKAEYDAREEV